MKLPIPLAIDLLHIQHMARKINELEDRIHYLEHKLSRSRDEQDEAKKETSESKD